MAKLAASHVLILTSSAPQAASDLLLRFVGHASACPGERSSPVAFGELAVRPGGGPADKLKHVLHGISRREIMGAQPML